MRSERAVLLVLFAVSSGAVQLLPLSREPSRPHERWRAPFTQATPALESKVTWSLSAGLSLRSDRLIRITGDAAGTRYAVPIDPLARLPWKAEGNQAGAAFGYSAGTAGDVNGDGYEDVIVGAPYYSNGQYSEGLAFVYYGSPTGLSTVPNWTGEINQNVAFFGFSVGTAGDVNMDGYDDVIVGAPFYSNGQVVEGGAFIYQGSAAGLSTTPNWTAEGNQVGARFGTSVATAGDVNGDGYSDAIVGAYLFDNGQIDEGRAFVYHGSSGGLNMSPNWTAESDQPTAYFGFSAGTAGDVNGDGYEDVIVGAPVYDNGQTDEGRAFVYHGSPGGLSDSFNWTAEGNQAFAIFGWSVGTAGDVNGDGYNDVIVGAYDYDNGQTNEGRAFAYHGSAVGLSVAPDWTAESDQAFAWFGYSVGTAGDVNGDGYNDVIVGAFLLTTGRAFVHFGSATGLSTIPNRTATGGQAGAEFSFSVGTAGDVNGDGYAEFVVGAPLFDHGQTDEGVVFVDRGRP